MIIRNRVVLPAPLAPMIPTIPAFGSENVRSSMSSLSPNALRSALDLDHGVAEARPGRDGDLELAGRVLGVVGLGQQLLVGGQSSLALGLPSLRRQAHPFELTSERPLSTRAAALLAAQALQLLLQPARVVALERDAPTAIQLQDPLGHVVEEVAVVGDGHDGARVLLEEPLQPEHRFRVEVVGRLVEQEQVGVTEQQPTQRDAALLAAREGADIGIVRRAAQGVHGDVDVALEAPCIGGRDLVLERALLPADGVVVGIRFGPLGHDRVVLIDQRLDPGDTVQDVALDVLGRVELGFLAEIADAEARA